MGLSGIDLRDRAIRIIKILQAETKGMVEPAVTQIVAQYGKDPFLVLTSCLLSLRTKDTVSLPASQRLFSLGKTPQEILTIPTSILEKTIYPVGFYRQKARALHSISTDILTRFNGKVPNTREALLTLKGVGPKTTALVLAEGFGIPAICVDTHVHRISNRLGLVHTQTPQETEQALMALLPQEYWSEYNRLMVMWGQNICVPVAPFVSKCALEKLCPKINVTRRR